MILQVYKNHVRKGVKKEIFLIWNLMMKTIALVLEDIRKELQGKPKVLEKY